MANTVGEFSKRRRSLLTWHTVACDQLSECSSSATLTFPLNKYNPSFYACVSSRTTSTAPLLPDTNNSLHLNGGATRTARETGRCQSAEWEQVPFPRKSKNVKFTDQHGCLLSLFWPPMTVSQHARSVSNAVSSRLNLKLVCQVHSQGHMHSRKTGPGSEIL